MTNWKRIVAVLVATIQLLLIVPAQELYISKQQGLLQLNTYLDRAALETSQARWQMLADEGFLVALATWENATLLEKERDLESWQQKKTEVESNFRQQKEYRYAKWLLEQFLLQHRNQDAQELSMLLNEYEQQWQYTASDGNKSRQILIEDANEAKKQWNNFVAEQDEVAKWWQKVSVEMEDLENVISEVNLDYETKRNLVVAAAATSKSILETEFQMVLEKEQNKLLGNLLYDRGSLKRLSATQAAEVIALQLAQEARAESTRATNQVLSKLDTELENNETEDIYLTQEKWLEEFRAKMEDALAKWEEAEIQFLASRTQWEQEASQVYLESEEAWLKSYETLRQARKDWENEILDKFNQGLENWRKAEEDLAQQIARAEAEIIQFLEEEYNYKEKIIESQVNIYNQSRQMMAMCHQGMEGWYLLWGEKYNNVYYYWKTESDENNITPIEKWFSEDPALQEFTCDLSYLLTSGGISLLKEKILNWKTSYLAMIKNQLNNEAMSKLSLELEKSKKELEEAEKVLSTNSNNNGTFENLLLENKKKKAEQDKIRLTKEIEDYKTKIQNLKKTIQCFFVLENESSSEQVKDVLGDFSYYFDEALWNSQDSLFNSEDGWLTLAEKYRQQSLMAIEKQFSLLGSTASSPYLDELELELMKSNATLTYWQNELNVATVLNDYAEDVSSGIENAAATEIALQEARKNYKIQLEQYELTIKQLTDAQENSDATAAEMSQAAKNLSIKQTEVAAARAEYQQALAVKDNIDFEYVEKQINNLLQEIYSVSQSESLEQATAYLLEYYTQLKTYGNLINIKNTNALIESLENGNEYYVSLNQFENLKEKGQLILDALNSGDNIVLLIAELNTFTNTFTKINPEVTSIISSDLAIFKNAIEELELQTDENATRKFQETKAALEKSLREGIVFLENEIIKRKEVLSYLSGKSLDEIWQEDSTNKDEIIRLYENFRIENLAQKDIVAGEAFFSLVEQEDFFSHQEIPILLELLYSLYDSTEGMHSSALDLRDGFISNVINYQAIYAYYNDLAKDISENLLQQTSEKYKATENDYNKVINWQNFIATNENYEQVLSEVLEIDPDQEELFTLYGSMLADMKNGIVAENFSDIKAQIMEKIQVILEEKNQQLIMLKWEMQYQKTILEEKNTQLYFLIERLVESGKAGFEELKDFRLEYFSSMGDIQLNVLNELYQKGSLYEIIDSSLLNIEDIERNLLSLQQKFEQHTNKTESLTELDNMTAILEIMNKSEAELDKECQEAMEKLQKKQSEQDVAQTEYNNSLEKYLKSVEEYNATIEYSEKQYEILKEKQLEKRIAQEKYDWATSIYLGTDTQSDYISPKEKLDHIRYSFQMQQVANDVLQSLLEEGIKFDDKEYNQSQKEYSDAVKEYYMARVLASEISEAIAQQEHKTRQAEAVEQNARLQIVKSYNKEENSLNDDTKNLIRLTKDENGEYLFTLAYDISKNITDDGKYKTDVTLKSSVAEQDESTIETYLNEKTEVFVRTDGIENLTKAETDAFEWWQEVFAKGQEYIENLLLAALYVRTNINNENQDNFLDIKNDNLFLADVLANDDFHGIDIPEYYRNGRIESLYKAYSKIIKNAEGDSDIAKLLFYRETNLAFDLSAREKAVVEKRGLESVISKLHQSEKEEFLLAGVNAGLSAMYYAMVFPFNWWALVPATTHAGTAIYHTSNGNSIKSMRKNAESLQQGKENIASIAHKEEVTKIQDYKEKENRLTEETKKLNLLKYGNSSGEQQEISYNDFLEAIDSAVKKSTAIDKGEELLVTTKELFQKAHGENKSKTVSDAVSKISLYLLKKETDAKENLNQIAQRLIETQLLEKKEYEAILNSAVELDYSTKEKLQQLKKNSEDKNISSQEREMYAEEYEKLLQETTERQKKKLYQDLKETGEKIWAFRSINHKLFLAKIEKGIYNSNVRLGGETEDYTVQVQKEILEQILEIERQEKVGRLLESQYEREKEQKEQERQIEEWQAQMYQIIRTGSGEWEKAEERLNAGYNQWRKEYQKEVEKKVLEWEENYKEFLQAKEEWIVQEYKSGTLQGTGVEEAIERRIGKVESMKVANVERIEEYLAESDVLGKIREVTNVIVGTSGDRLGIKQGYDKKKEVEERISIEQVVEENRKAMEKVAEKVAISQWKEMLEKVKKGYVERIEKENAMMEKWQEELALNSGYSIEGEISREVVIDSTVMKAIKERQSMHRYEKFRVELPKEKGTAKNMAELEIEQLEVRAWGERVFGDEKGQYILERSVAARGEEKEYQKNEEKILELGTEEIEKREEGEIVRLRAGELGRHIGYAPQFKTDLDLSKNKDENIADKGMGQMGKIMLDYHWNRLRSQAGIVELSKAMYDKKLWESEGSWIEPPTVRGVVDIATSVIGNIAGGAALGTIIGYVDDLIFAGADITGGYKSAAEVGLELGKKAISTAMSAGIGAGSNALGDLAGKAMQGVGKVGNFATQAGISMTTNYVTTVANSAVNSLYIGQDGLAFNTDNFTKSLYSTDTISGALGAGITGGMGGLNLRDENNIKLNSNTFNVSGISAFNSLAGGLVQNGVALAFGENATFNLVNAYGVGLLELTVGKDGISSRLGMGGTNISYQNLRNVAAGYKEASKVTDWKHESTETSSTLNSINMLGYTTSGMNQQLAKDIWSEKLAVEYIDFEGNALGRVDTDNNTIYISEKLLGGGKEGSAQLASMFSHEGIHLGGYDELQARVGGYDTYAQLQEKFGVTGESYDSISDIAYMTEVYKQYGEMGVFTELFFGDVFYQDNLENDLYLAGVADPGWRQNEIQNKGIILGNGYTEELVKAYNDKQKSNAYNVYKKEQYALHLIDESVIDKKTIDEFAPNVSLTDFTNEDAMKYGYIPTKVNDLYGYACTLSTAAYVAYSITGELSSLKDANSLLAKNDVFARDLIDNQKNLLNYGSTYAKAINVLSKATFDVIEYESSFYKGENMKDMENYLLNLKEDTNDEYFVHLRTNSKNNPNNYSYHSVLLNDIEYINTQDVPESVLHNSPTIKLNILDPAGQYTQKDIYQIGRADAYKLTEYGKIYKDLRNSTLFNIIFNSMGDKIYDKQYDAYFSKLDYVNKAYYWHNFHKFKKGVDNCGY
ncbi:MAG: hypothetical protein J6B81_02765 [Spirochaetaceae bacterium]|nr:hypothetical protein [Spirochaetaceae bacterium]